MYESIDKMRLENQTLSTRVEAAEHDLERSRKISRVRQKALRAQRDEMHAAATAAHNREAALQDQLADTQARVKELEAAGRELLAAVATTDSRRVEAAWDAFVAVLRSDREKQND